MLQGQWENYTYFIEYTIIAFYPLKKYLTSTKPLEYIFIFIFLKDYKEFNTDVAES